MSLTFLLASVLLPGLAISAPATQADAGTAIPAASFAQKPPQGWEVSKGWVFSPHDAKADGDCTATWQGPVPGSCWIEVVVDLPQADALAKGAALSISVSPPGNEAGKITASGAYAKPQCKFTLVGVGADAKPLSVSVARYAVT